MITRAHIRRQLRASGGITNAVPRQGYFLGKIVKGIGKGGKIYVGKSSKYPGISNIIKKNKLKVIPINIGLKKNK